MYFEINETNKEITSHITEELPLAIYHRQLNKKQKDRIMPHWHQEFQFVWVLKGILNYSIETEKIQLNSSSGILINSSKLHSAEPQTETVEYLCIDFSPFFVNRQFYEKVIAAIENNVHFTFVSLTLSSHQEKILQTLVFTKENINFLTVYELLLGILSQIDIQTLHAERTPLAIYQLLEYVHTHYQEPLSVDDLAQVIPINKNKCTHLFNEYTHLSPINYLIDYRLNQSKKLLQTTDLTISEIAYAVGFNHLSYFITKFKKKYNYTPLQFRKQSRV